MKIVAISDTHGMHRQITHIPDGDVLVHAGDISNVGEKDQVEDFVSWISSLPHKHKIFIVGNHDRSFDPKFNREINPYWDAETTAIFNTAKKKPFWLQDLLTSLEGTSTHYLEDNEVVIDGVKFWGSPWTPWFHGDYWGFNKHRGEEIQKVLKLIPQDVDVLITHGPPAHKLDWCGPDGAVGCHDLINTINQIKPKYNIFGHIHESYGVISNAHTTFVNASTLNENYQIANEPIVLEI